MRGRNRRIARSQPASFSTAYMCMQILGTVAKFTCTFCSRGFVPITTAGVDRRASPNPNRSPEIASECSACQVQRIRVLALFVELGRVADEAFAACAPERANHLIIRREGSACAFMQYCTVRALFVLSDGDQTTTVSRKQCQKGSAI